MTETFTFTFKSQYRWYRGDSHKTNDESLGFRVGTTLVQIPTCFGVGLYLSEFISSCITQGWDDGKGDIRIPAWLGTLSKQGQLQTQRPQGFLPRASRRCQVRTQCLVFGAYLINSGRIGTHLEAKLPTDHHSDATNSSKGIRSPGAGCDPPNVLVPAWDFGLGSLVCFNEYEIQGPETSGHLFKVTQQVKARVRWDVLSVSPLVALGHAGPCAAGLSLRHHIKRSNPDCQVSPSSSQPGSIGACQGTERANPWSFVAQWEA